MKVRHRLYVLATLLALCAVVALSTSVAYGSDYGPIPGPAGATCNGYWVDPPVAAHVTAVGTFAGVTATQTVLYDGNITHRANFTYTPEQLAALNEPGPHDWTIVATWDIGTGSSTFTGTQTCNRKVLVCKYVGTPGPDERVKLGKNPIEVDAHSLTNDGPVNIGDTFQDAQGFSRVVADGTEVCPGQTETPPPPPPETTTTTTAPPAVTTPPPADTDHPVPPAAVTPQPDCPNGADANGNCLPMTGPSAVGITAWAGLAAIVGGTALGAFRRRRSA